MEKTMMIDYREEVTGVIVRKEIDDAEFCIRNGRAWFISKGEKFNTPIDTVIQVFLV